jgi:DNA-binding response OmpR family regulator
MKLLIIEDNVDLSNDLSAFFIENGFIVETADDISSALQKLYVYNYDIIILDLGLPDGSGLTILREVKENKLNIGILIVTARNTLEDKIKGLELGADDYITKPFHKSELNARVRSILRRKNFDGHNYLEIGNMVADILAFEVKVTDTPLELTRKEFDLLLYFLYNFNRVLTKESIVEHLWGDHADQSDNFDFIYNHIKNLRKKLKKAGSDGEILSVYGMGYKFSLK